MLIFVKENIGTILIGTIVAVLAVLAIVKIRKDKSNGGCGCGCDGCSKSNACNK